MDDRRLYWIAKNRTRPDFVRRIGEWVTPLSGGLESEHEELSVVEAVIRSEVEEKFHENCWVACVQTDCVVICVDEPSLVSPLQRQWSGAILKALHADKRYRQLARVIFRNGRAGARFHT